jgi:UDP-N-acetylglucosamine 1-carboxyvinyltransferase
MGGKIVSKDGIISIKHSSELIGTTVEASEIRAGVALVGLALMAKGTTVINKADNILRGYERIVEKMAGLSIKIKIVDETAVQE